MNQTRIVYKEILLEKLYNAKDKYFNIYLDGFLDGKCDIETVKKGICYYFDLIQQIETM